MAENKVQFNLKNVHYAVLTVAEDGTVSFGDPVHVPGAVSLALEQQGEITKFYADGIVFYQNPQNNGYQGDLEMARFPDQMMKDIWNFTETDDKVLVEEADAEAAAFALLYQIDGDVSSGYYCLYNCTATRPAMGGTTNSETKTPQTQSSTISAAPLADNKISARTTAATSEAVKASWLKSVYLPTAAAT